MFDELLNAYTTDFGKLRDKPLIKAGSGAIERNRKNLLYRRFCHAGIVVDQQLTLEVEAVKTVIVIGCAIPQPLSIIGYN